MNEHDTIKSLGRLEGYRHDVEGMRTVLDDLPMWEPAARLKKECHEVLNHMEGMHARFHRKLVMTIIGPGGAGKSTLMNAIAGMDDLSAAGSRRPTTEKAVLLCQTAQDADGLTNELGAVNVQTVIDPGNRLLDHCMLVDTPDTDSTARDHHIPLVSRAIKSADVLLCVFNAENPKTRDSVDFFSEYIPYFHGRAVIGILNKCDRIEEDELRQAILPGFKRYIKKAWDRPLASLFCISARRHLQQPAWDENTRPRHEFDEYPRLMEALSQILAQPAHGPGYRVENARHLRNFIRSEIDATIEKVAPYLREARGQAVSADQAALKNAFGTLREDGSRQGLGMNVLLYQRLANQWVGPVGWMIAIWARILIFGTGLMAMFRFGNPIRQLWGVISSMRHFKDARIDVDDARSDARVGKAMQAYRVVVLQRWPNIAETLVKGGFQTRVRRIEEIIPQQQDLHDALTEMWQQSLNATLDRQSRIFSNIILQVIFNLPIVVLLGHIGWLTTRHYVAGEYLASDFFLHAFITAAIILLLSFFLFQAILRLFSSPESMLRLSFRHIQQQIDPLSQLSRNPLLRQLDLLLGMGTDRQPDP